MLMPKKQKYRKQMRGTMKGDATRGIKLSFGDFGLQSISAAWVSSRQIEAGRRAISHYTARGGRIWIRIFPDKPVSKKPAEVRMGGGKGDTNEYVVTIRPGKMLYEISGVTLEVAKEALRLASHKMPVKTRFVARTDK